MRRVPRKAKGGKKSLFNKWCWDNWISKCKVMIVDPLLTPYAQINSKRITDLKVRPEIVRLLKEDTGEKFLDIALGNDFLAMTPKA